MNHSVQHSAHDLCRTRLCQAAGCEAEADSGLNLCTRCEHRRKRDVRIQLHIIDQPFSPDRDTQLCCTSCGNWKPDDDFRRGQGNGPKRRGRKCECRVCDTIRRRAYRANLSPEKRAEQKENERARKSAKAASRREAKRIAAEAPA